MPSRQTWRKLLPGLVALAVTIFAAVGIVMFASAGSVRGDSVRLHVVSDEARGVMRGTDVWLSGQRIGVVSDIAFLPPSADTNAHVVMTVTVEADEASNIRRDSRTDVRVGARLMGPVVVYIEPGTPQSAPVADGDTLRTERRADVELAMVKLSNATSEFTPLMSDAKAVMAQMRNPRGTIGAFMTSGLPQPVHELRARLVRISNRNGTGVAARGFLARARLALARADSVRRFVASPASSFGRFRRDATLAAAVDDLRTELSTLEAQLRDGDGTLARVGADRALTNAVAAAKIEMAELFADMRRRPSRYINF
jgi:hypothetical protein